MIVKFEDNNVFDNVKDLFGFLLDHWKFRWLYAKGKENGVAEYENYERSLTKEQREEREKILLDYLDYNQRFEVIWNDKNIRCLADNERYGKI